MLLVFLGETLQANGYGSETDVCRLRRVQRQRQLEHYAISARLCPGAADRLPKWGGEREGA